MLRPVAARHWRDEHWLPAFLRLRTERRGARRLRRRRGGTLALIPGRSSSRMHLLVPWRVLLVATSEDAFAPRDGTLADRHAVTEQEPGPTASRRYSPPSSFCADGSGAAIPRATRSVTFVRRVSIARGPGRRPGGGGTRGGTENGGLWEVGPVHVAGLAGARGPSPVFLPRRRHHHHHHTCILDWKPRRRRCLLGAIYRELQGFRRGRGGGLGFTGKADMV